MTQDLSFHTKMFSASFHLEFRGADTTPDWGVVANPGEVSMCDITKGVMHNMGKLGSEVLKCSLALKQQNTCSLI